jgi:hypothetical protein
MFFIEGQTASLNQLQFERFLAQKARGKDASWVRACELRIPSYRFNAPMTVSSLTIGASQEGPVGVGWGKLLKERYMLKHPRLSEDLYQIFGAKQENSSPALLITSFNEIPTKVDGRSRSFDYPPISDIVCGFTRAIVVSGTEVGSSLKARLQNRNAYLTETLKTAASYDAYWIQGDLNKIRSNQARVSRTKFSQMIVINIRGFESLSDFEKALGQTLTVRPTVR